MALLLIFSLLLSLSGSIIAPADFEEQLGMVQPPVYASSEVMGSTVRGNNLTLYAISRTSPAT
jgi:hypothetical protein